VTRGEVYWAELGAPAGRRPIVIITRTPALAWLRSVTIAPVSTTIRGVRSEVPLGKRHGLARRSVANCDALATIPTATLDRDPVGRLRRSEFAALDQAIRFALGVRF
jgi:mRNA interferase MazF